MFYAVSDGHHLPHDPFNAIVSPRPIGWIGTVSAAGAVNLAPFSYFNAVSARPPMVVFAANAAHAGDGGEKDTLANARATGQFVANLATWDLRRQVNETSAPAPRGSDEMALAGLTAAPCRLVRPPRVAEAPASLECEVIGIVPLPDDPRTGQRNTAVFGRVVGVHIDERVLRADGRFDVTMPGPLAPLGYFDYAAVEGVFEMRRPAWPRPAAAAPGQGRERAGP